MPIGLLSRSFLASLRLSHPSLSISEPEQAAAQGCHVQHGWRCAAREPFKR